MNLAGHIAVAVRLHPDRPRLWLGAALPDLATIGGFRLLGRIADAEVSAGVHLHHRTDDAFHRHRHFTEPQGRLRARLAGDGVARGPARAVAHVGPELLLDGELLTDPGLADAVDLALAAISELDLGSAVDSERRDDWLDHLSRVPHAGLPTDYDDPGAVSRRLHRILARRPRLSFGPDHVDIIHRRLAAEQPAIVETAPELLTELERELSGVEPA